MFIYQCISECLNIEVQMRYPNITTYNIIQQLVFDKRD